MFSRYIKIFSCLLLILLAVSVASAKQIQVPAIHDNNPIMLRLGSYKIANVPNFEFTRINRKSVYYLEDDSLLRFVPCAENKAEIQFNVVDNIIFSGIPRRPTIPFNFNDIKYSQFLLDIYYEDSRIFAIFKNQKVIMIRLNDKKRIDKTRMVQIQGLNDDQYLEVGYIIRAQQHLLFVNRDFVIKITQTDANVIKSYQPVPNFESVIALDYNLFAVAKNDEGINIYTFNGTSTILMHQISPQQLDPTRNETSLKDIIYWKKRNQLITLDEIYGLKTYSLKIKQNSYQLSYNTRITDMPDCKLMYLYGETLYAFCSRMVVFDLTEWPDITEKEVPFPNLQVKQIYEIDDIVAFVGRNSFSVLYMDRLVNFYQQKDLDKLLMFQDLFITADQTGINVGDYELIKPYISCSTDNQQFLGTTKLLFKTIAQCNEDLLLANDINPKSLGTIEEGDVCLYSVYKPITIWKEGEIKILPFLIGLIVVIVIALIVLAVYCLKKLKLKRYISMIEQYSTQHISQSAKQHQFVEQMQGGPANSDEKKDDAQKQTQVELTDQSKQKQQKATQKQSDNKKQQLKQDQNQKEQKISTQTQILQNSRQNE